jgi:acyl-CoA thioesterase-1
MRINKRVAASITTLAATAALFVWAGKADATTPSWCTDRSDVAILGTSAETGYATTGYSSTTEEFYPTLYGWTTKFANDMHASYGTAVSNFAHNGALSADFLPGGGGGQHAGQPGWSRQNGAVATFATTQPSIVILDVGGNDFYSQVDPATFRANLNAIIDNIRAQRSDTLILLSIYAQLHWSPNPYTPVPNGPMVWGWGAYAGVIHDVAVAKGTALSDMRQYVPPADGTLTAPDVWAADRIHLTDAGNLAEYGAFWGRVSSTWDICPAIP